MLKHPNWRRDLDAHAPTSSSNGVATSGGSFTTPQYVDTSSFAISNAVTSASRTVAAVTVDMAQPSDTVAENSSIGRPFSPGAEVVFWAVKGEFSVKLVGTVDSVSADSGLNACTSVGMDR